MHEGARVRKAKGREELWCNGEEQLILLAVAR